MLSGYVDLGQWPASPPFYVVGPIPVTRPLHLCPARPQPSPPQTQGATPLPAHLIWLALSLSRPRRPLPALRPALLRSATSFALIWKGEVGTQNSHL